MARTKGKHVYGRAGRRRYHLAVYITEADRDALHTAADRDGVMLTEWVRRLVVAELGRLAVRERLAQ